MKIELNKSLPVAQFENQIATSIEEFSNTIVIGRTGSGKTTQIPLIILKNLERWNLSDKFKVAITEPRRLAATSVSKYVSAHIGEQIAETVGYKIRFDDSTTASTVLNFMTEGILLREMESDPLLMSYAYIMVDEAHERNLNTDFILGLVKDIQKKRRNQKLTPLKIIVTSATLQRIKFEEYLAKDAKEPLSSIIVPGRTFEIEKHLLKIEPKNYILEAVDRVLKIEQSGKPGDILIFMPGKFEIAKVIKEVEFLNIKHNLNLLTIPVHAELPIEEQEKIFAPTLERKVVVSTNVAETSITVPNVVFVIDSGLVRQMDYNPVTQIKSLVLKEHAKKGLEQRMGRAGRVKNGVYYGLYTKKSLANRQEFQTPEIQRSNLAEVVLKMKSINIDDIYGFDFIDKPPKKLMIDAEQELKSIDALDMVGNITDLGKFFVQLPLNPKIANLLYLANKNDCLEPMVVISSFLEIKPVFVKLTNEVLSTYLEKQNKDITDINLEKELAIGRYKQDQFKSKFSDFETFLNIWDSWAKSGYSIDFADQNYLSIDSLLEAKDAREQIIEILKKHNFQLRENIEISNFKHLNITKTLLKAFKSNIIYYKPKYGFSQLFGTLNKIQFYFDSVLRRKKVETAIAYEIITLEHPGEKLKASARILADIPKHVVLKEYPATKRKLINQFTKHKKYKQSNGKVWRRKKKRR